MFTGLVQAVGNIRLQGKGLLIEGYPTAFKINIGDSVAVDGVCLTVASFRNNGFLADISEETLQRTTLREKAIINGKVNLELALRLSDRLGGHLVSGHVDGLGKVISIEKLPNSWSLGIAWEEKNFAKYICEKASVSVDGISLTVSKVTKNGASFYIAVIPHTWTETSLQYLSTGKYVNLETDIMAKYAERLLLGKNYELDNSNQINQENISESWLVKHGWT